jgi:signal-transduction protein with cAMP-binding, CBS, and nucleotidyltransferase domain
MSQVMTAASAQAQPSNARVAAATVADLIRLPLATVSRYDHAAAAAYLMKHSGATALMVTDARTSQPAGIITGADIARAIVERKDLNDVRVHEVMTTRPAITTTSSIRDAAATMTARHYRHLPVTGNSGLLGVIDLTDVCQALSNAKAA